MRDRLTAIVAIVLLLGLIAASYWYAVSTSYENLKYIPSKDSPDFIGKDVTLIRFNKDGSAKNRLQAKEIKHYSDDRIYVTEPQVSSVTPNEPAVRASAQFGESLDGGETFQFRGDVHVSREASEKAPASSLKTPEMTVFTDTNRFETDAPVVIVNGHDRMEGEGMIFDNLARTVEIKNKVKTHIEPRKGSKSNLMLPQ